VGGIVEILGKTNIDFIGKRHVAYAVSTVLILVGIVALIQISRGAANMGIDFAGGTATQVKFARPVDLGAVRDALSKNGIKDSEPQQFADGRTVTAPLAWYPRLLHGTAKERANWRLIGGGEGVHWPDLDEDISVENVLLGHPSGESQRSFKQWLETRKGGNGSR